MIRLCLWGVQSSLRLNQTAALVIRHRGAECDPPSGTCSGSCRRSTLRRVLCVRNDKFVIASSSAQVLATSLWADPAAEITVLTTKIQVSAGGAAQQRAEGILQNFSAHRTAIQHGEGCSNDRDADSCAVGVAVRPFFRTRPHGCASPPGAFTSRARNPLNPLQICRRRPMSAAAGMLLHFCAPPWRP